MCLPVSKPNVNQVVGCSAGATIVSYVSINVLNKGNLLTDLTGN